MTMLRAVGAVPPLRLLLTRVCRPPRSLAVDRLVPMTSPLGVAAGLDKNAHAVAGLVALGFGSVEVGTVTARPQPGNPRPRLVRLPADRAIVNRMGFNNDGAAVVADRLRRLRRSRAGRDLVIGVNIGRSKTATDAETLDDYRFSARTLAPYADWLTVNISSPNTPGLRDLHAPDRLRPLLDAVRQTCERTATRRTPLPLLLKISPDLADDDVAVVAEIVRDTGFAGVITTNTTVSRDGLRTPAAHIAAAGDGGLSGSPLGARAADVQGRFARALGPSAVIVGSGGIVSEADAAARLHAGAAVVQSYTGLVYGGPSWPRRVNRLLANQR